MNVCHWHVDRIGFRESLIEEEVIGRNSTWNFTYSGGARFIRLYGMILS